MNLLVSASSDPYWNLATEEYLLKSSTEDFILLYVNKPTIVIGKHQIVPKEINTRYALNNKILIARRLSGGGAVYHDDGNLNFSFIHSIKFGETISYKSITKSIFDFLIKSNIAVSLSERNDFIVSGKKISGSAMHVYKDRVLAHNTLLINCQLDNLSNSLKGNIWRFTDRSISSVRSEVMNLSTLKRNLSIPTVIKDYSNFLEGQLTAVRTYILTENDKNGIKELSINKYSTRDWIYNYSPKYIYKNTIQLKNEIIAYTLEIEKGIICTVKTESIFDINPSINLSINSLKGKQHNLDALSELFKSSNNNKFETLLLSSLF